MCGGCGGTGVCEKEIPPDKNAGWKISFENTKSGAGLQFRLLGRMAKAPVKGVFLFTDTGIALGCRGLGWRGYRDGGSPGSAGRYGKSRVIRKQCVCIMQ